MGHAGKMAVGGEIFRADQEGVAGECRIALVGGVAGRRRIEGEHLPPGLARGGEAVDKPAGGGTKVPDAIRPWEGGGVEENAGGPA